MADEPFFQDDHVTLYHGDCLQVLVGLPDCSVDSVVTDPPYGLEFMGKDWDSPWKDSAASKGAVVRDPAKERGGFQDGNGGNPYSRSRIEFGRGGEASVGFQVWCQKWAEECLRVLKPGGHILAFGGTRTWHRLACAVEDAGFEIRDSIAWLYGSGFPKSLDVSKAIDKAAGAEREVISEEKNWGKSTAEDGKQAYGDYAGEWSVTAPATEDAKRWSGWGTALKPSFEPVVVGRKPLVGTVAANVVANGTGALNIDATRVGNGGQLKWSTPRNMGYRGGSDSGGEAEANSSGRWPSNAVVDECSAAEIDRQSGVSRSTRGEMTRKPTGLTLDGGRDAQAVTAIWGHDDEGGASRFFPTFRYQAKAPTDQRPTANGIAHPTVKPLDLMRWLVRLVTPPGGIVLDPFAGSGTTAEAAVHEHMRCITVEREPDYLPLIVNRLTKPMEIGFDFDS